MSVKYPDSGIQVGFVLPKGTKYVLGLASVANFIRAVATIFGALFFCRKRKTKFSYTLLKSSVYFVSMIWDQTNSNDVHFF